MGVPVKPNRATWLTPYMTARDVDAIADFYQRAFGFEILELAKGEDGTTWHAEFRYQDQLVMMGKQGVYGKGAESPATTGVDCPIIPYVYCEDVDKFYEHALKEGAVSVIKPDDMFWGDRMCSVKDPEGYMWSFATHKGEGIA
ncbi:MAG: glyoxalase [Gammaproteobacteria bacterium]|jgi:uncharacterized glyoxalase superfamily protein PhnB|nr:glyoxalase [Gammaproteobacteria bacterium]